MSEPTPEFPDVMARAAYLASKAMMQARLSGKPYVGYAEMGRAAAEAVAPLVAEHIAEKLGAAAANYPPDIFPPDSDSRDAIGGTAMRHAYGQAARIAREAFPTGDNHG